MFSCYSLNSSHSLLPICTHRSVLYVCGSIVSKHLFEQEAIVLVYYCCCTNYCKLSTFLEPS